ncbi:hypothetical protein BH11MYX2_BH11MYX2_17960 [soil metagenome]
MKYRVTAGSLVVKARSRLHDVQTTWSKITGEVDADASAIEGAHAAFVVDMTAFDAGDFIKNRKLRSDFQLEANPSAKFVLRAVKDVVRDGAKFTATAEGVLSWRGKDVVLALAGRGTLDDMRVEATATFELDIRKLGLSAPRFLMIKMDDEVSVEVRVAGEPA